MLSMDINHSCVNGYGDANENGCQCCPYGFHIDVSFVSFAEETLSMKYAEERLQELREKMKSDREKLLGTRSPGYTVKPTYKDAGVSTIIASTDASTDNPVSFFEDYDESQISPISSPRSEISTIDFILEPLEENEESFSISDSLMSLQEPREKMIPTQDIQDALKTLNDALLRGKTTVQVTSAINNILIDWFKLAGAKTANPFDVKDYLECFENYSQQLLRYIVNMPDTNGNTALHYAVSHENFGVVSILLNSNVCDPNKANKAGYTCVMLVALAKISTESHRQVVRRLLSMSDVNIKAAQHSQTALILGASHGRLDTVKLLVEAGADVNVQDEDGSTALMCAAEHGHIDIIKYLLAQKDCDSNIVDNDGCTALRVAMEAGNKDIGVMLYAHMHFYNSPAFRTTSNSPSLLSKRSRSMTPSSRYANSSPVVAKKQHSQSSINFMNMTIV